MPKQDIAVEVYYDGAWHDIVADDDVFADDPIVIMRGQGDESPALRPAEITCTLANDDDRYRTTNPESPLYGKAGRNTPVRVSIGGVVRGATEASSWTARQSRDFRRFPRRGKAWVELEAGGLLQRINQWSKNELSAMRDWISSYTNLRGYWPCEDSRDASQLSNAYVGGRPGYATSGVTFQGADGPGGSDQLISVTSTAVFGGTFASMSTTAGWQIGLSFDLSEVTLTGVEVPLFQWTTSNGYTWEFGVSTTTYGILVTDQDGVVLEDSSSLFGSGAAPQQWITMRFKVSASGGTVSIEIAWYPEDTNIIYGVTPTFSGTVGRPTSWRGGTMDGAHLGHVFAVAGITDNLQSYNFLASFRGYAGETAGARFTRLCAAKGIESATIGDENDSFPMGPQRVDTFPNLLREIVATEDGLIYDAGDALELVFLLRAERYNQTPAVELTPEDFPALPDEVTDDLDTHNIVTVSQREGGDYTASDDTGPLGTLPPPDGVGEYRQTVDVNVNDEAELPQLANWWLRRGTVDLPRYPAVTLNLAALSASRIAEIETIDVGSVITIVGYREYTIRLIVLGWKEVIGTHRRSITFTCAPDQQFAGGEYNDGVARYDSATTTVKTALGLSDTTVTFRTTSQMDLWSTTGTPYDVIIAGQRSRVTAMGAASLVSGAYDQAATVVRGVDGIRKSIAAGESIHVATPGRYAL